MNRSTIAVGLFVLARLGAVGALAFAQAQPQSMTCGANFTAYLVHANETSVGQGAPRGVVCVYLDNFANSDGTAGIGRDEYQYQGERFTRVPLAVWYGVVQDASGQPSRVVGFADSERHGPSGYRLRATQGVLGRTEANAFEPVFAGEVIDEMLIGGQSARQPAQPRSYFIRLGPPGRGRAHGTIQILRRPNGEQDRLATLMEHWVAAESPRDPQLPVIAPLDDCGAGFMRFRAHSAVTTSGDAEVNYGLRCILIASIGNFIGSGEGSRFVWYGEGAPGNAAAQGRAASGYTALDLPHLGFPALQTQESAAPLVGRFLNQADAQERFVTLMRCNDAASIADIQLCSQFRDPRYGWTNNPGEIWSNQTRRQNLMVE